MTLTVIARPQFSCGCGSLGGLLRRGKPPTCRGNPPRNDAHCHCERNGVERGNLGGLLRRGKTPRNDGS